VIPGQGRVPPNVQLGELKGAWDVTKKAMPKERQLSPGEVESLRIAFYMGAHTYQSILSNAARLPDPYPQQVINATDKELDEFKAEMHHLAQRAVDAARQKELGEIEPGAESAVP
jgi:hypothetical protein